MSEKFPSDIEYLVFTINKNRYGVAHHEVVSVMDIPEITIIPRLPTEIRGVLPFRGGNIPLFDLRVSFGVTTRDQETKDLVENLAQRRQDHINWLNKLEEEVHNAVPISVQTNPHLCAFGKWYDKFESDNANLRSYMLRFDEPHKAIHALAIEAKKLIDSNDTDGAKALIAKAKVEVLTRLLGLFDGIGELVEKYLKEYMVVLDTGTQPFAIAVDDINFFSPLSDIEHPLPRGMTSSNREADLVQAISHHREGSEEAKSSVLLLDVNVLMENNPEALTV